MPWVLFFSMLLLELLGLFLNILTLPGLWLMVLAHVTYGWLTGWDVYVGLPSTIAIFVLAALAEVMELRLGTAGAKKAGATTRATIGAVVGAIVGGIFLTGLVPIPIIGTILGVCLGAFAGAAIVEFLIKGDPGQSFRVGAGAAKGRLMGIFTKLVFGTVILAVSFISALPISPHRLNALSVIRLPATTSATTRHP